MKIDISKIAKLANLSLQKNEEDELGSQLTTILNYIEKLKEINTDNVEETSQVTGLENQEREDSITASLDQKNSLSNAKKKHDGFFEVNAILE
jgi:aspartyl-tRNA(Asn)/glutamyl-tRNA(Gln) amidotransferase subunit C